MKRSSRSLGRALVAVLVLAAAACGREPEASATRDAPVLLIGVDGFEWNIALPLFQRGELPNLAALIREGRYGLLETLEPTLSPIIWTTIATAKSPAEHGIRGFARPGGGLYTNRDRKTKALWNIASDAGKRSAVVGWWMTFPAEPIDGVMISQTNTEKQLQRSIGGGSQIMKGQLVDGVAGQVYPPERQNAALARYREVAGELDSRLTKIFGTFATPLTPLGQQLWESCRWAFRADATYAALGEELLREEPGFDLSLVYLGGPDVVGHRFFRHYMPEAFRHPPAAEQVANLGPVIDAYYRYIDAIVGRLRSAASPATRVIVVSDHGMHPVNFTRHFDPQSPPRDLNSGHHVGGTPGFWAAAGPGIARSGAEAQKLERAALPEGLSVLDIAPSILTLMGIAIGEDMGGEASSAMLSDAFLEAQPPARIATHDTPEWLAAHAQLSGGDPGEDERQRQLRELGYIE